MIREFDIPQHPSRTYRFLEIAPAVITWGIFLGITLLSLIAPVVMASLILIYVIYWFAKSLLMSYHLILGYREYRRAIQIDWQRQLETNPFTKDQWRDIWHLVVIANANEELPIIRATLTSLTQVEYPLDRILIIIANEERYREIAAINQVALRKEFNRTFGGFWTTLHPQNIRGEVRGKGANISYAARQVLPEIEKMGLNPSKVLVTTLDADHRPHSQFFAATTWAHLHDPAPDLKTYQPLPMFFNNIWSVPFVIRSISVGSSFWQMIEATRPYRLRNFAAQTQSLELLKKTDFWSNQTIVEDGHQYWRSFFATKGKHAVVPIFIPIYQDAVLSPRGYLMTYREQYLQKRRWAWGVSDIPYVLTNLWRNRRELPSWGWIQAVRLVEGHISWATTSLVLAVFGWFPTLLSPVFRTTVLSYNFSLIYHRLLTVAMIGILVSLILSRLMLPPRPKHKFTSSDLIEWILTPILLPFANISFGSFAAIDAQTRLALGQYLGFRVTEKAVVRQELTAQSSQPSSL